MIAARQHVRPISGIETSRTLTDEMDKVGMAGKGDILEPNDMLRFLRQEAERAGGISIWARKVGIDRSTVHQVLAGQRPASRRLIEALGLEIVYRRRQ